MSIVILDLDDTLSDASHRKHLVETKAGKPDFDKFNREAYKDKPNLQVINRVRELKEAGNKIVILTGRSEVVRQQTETWLRTHRVPYDVLKMRPAGSTQKSTDLKRQWMRDYKPSDVVAAIDDKPENLTMFRGMGIKAYRVKDGKIEGSIVGNPFLNKVKESK